VKIWNHIQCVLIFHKLFHISSIYSLCFKAELPLYFTHVEMDIPFALSMKYQIRWTNWKMNTLNESHGAQGLWASLCTPLALRTHAFYQLLSHELQLTGTINTSVQRHCSESIKPVIKTKAWGTLMFSRPENWSEFDINQVNVLLGG
jgi:hypothetical protein